MNHSIKPKLFGGILLFALSICLSSCNGTLDDIFGEWDKPSSGTVTPSSDKKSAATITNAPTATASIIAGETTALVTAGTADGGTMMYQVTTTNTKPTSTDGFSDELPTAASLDPDSYFVWYYAKADATHTDSEIAAAAIEIAVDASLSMPLTLKAITAGTITVGNPPASMQFSLDGGSTKTDVSDVSGNISVAEGNKVTFYGSTESYGNDGTYFGGTAQVKIYGNIMSLVGTAFADNKTLTVDQTFKALFTFYNKLIDASGLLLPATTLRSQCYMSMFYNCNNLTKAPKELPATNLTSAGYCYNGMFWGCSSLTTAPKLPATTLDENCYQNMFNGCTSLTTAYVKAAYIAGYPKYECDDMFEGCSENAILHTTSANKASWEAVMGSGHTWATWTVSDDWND